MSWINFLYTGHNPNHSMATQNLIKRCTTVPHPPKYSTFNGIITHSSDDSSVRIIDNTLSFTDLGYQRRVESIQFWNGIILKTSLSYACLTTTSIYCLVHGIKQHSYKWVTLSVSCSIMSLFLTNRIVSAVNSQDNFIDRISIIQQMRRKCDPERNKHAYSVIYKTKLIGSVVTKNEARKIWAKDIQAIVEVYKERLNSPEALTHSDYRDFFENCPLTKSEINYLSYQDSEELQRIASEFEKIQSEYGKANLDNNSATRLNNNIESVLNRINKYILVNGCSH